MRLHSSCSLWRFSCISNDKLRSKSLFVGRSNINPLLSTVVDDCGSLNSVRRKKRRGFLGIVAAPVVQFRRAGIAMPGSLLHVFELGAVLKRRGDEGGAHRMRRVAAV